MPEPGVARAEGASTQVAQLAVVTTYRLETGARWITADSAFSNGAATPLAVWVGDVIDHDGAGQRSGVAGHGTITSGPTDFTPAGRWIGMTGTDGQLYASSTTMAAGSRRRSTGLDRGGHPPAAGHPSPIRDVHKIAAHGQGPPSEGEQQRLAVVLVDAVRLCRDGEQVT